MSKTSRPAFFYRIMQKMNLRIAANYRKGLGPTGVVLLLTTVGRKSGLPRTTPIQYEKIDGAYTVGSARGPQADWYRNVLANPRVEVQVKKLSFKGTAEAVSDPARVADFLAYRLKRRPIFIGLTMRLEGLPIFFKRADLERFAAQKTMVIIRPEGESQERQ
jgi:deazaflavin-dependent oxidoreductase (nitroreductase family)